MRRLILFSLLLTAALGPALAQDKQDDKGAATGRSLSIGVAPREGTPLQPADAAGGLAGTAQRSTGTAGDASPSTGPAAGDDAEEDEDEETVSPADPGTLIAALQASGYRAALDKDGGGDPMITSSASGLNFVIFFYGCTGGAGCGTVQFHAGFTGADKATDEKLMAWNQEYRFTKTFRDKEKDPVIVLDVVFGADGMSLADFQDVAKLWDSQLGTYARYIEFN